MGALRKMRNGLVRGMEWLLIGMVIVLTLDVLWGVFTRFVLGCPLSHKYLGTFIPEVYLGQAPYTDELACVMLVWISMIGGALAFGRKAHLGVDFFVNLLHPTAKKAMFILVQGLIITLAVTVFLIGGWKLAMAQMGQMLPTMPWLSRGVVYLSLPLAGLFIILFSAENMAEVIQTPAEKLGSQTQSEG